MSLLPATIDIGSHSCLLLIAQWEPSEQGPKLQAKIQKIAVCRLGDDIHQQGHISPERTAELQHILVGFRTTIHALGARLEAVVMTEAMRQASHPDSVLDAVEKALWVRPRIISGEEEAMLTYRAVAGWHGNNIVTLDVGGGSSELSQGKVHLSIPVGALKLFQKMGAIPGPEYKAWAKETFKELNLKPFAKKPLFLVGGSATALGMLHLGASQFDASALEGLELTPHDLDRHITRLSDLSRELRAALPGLDHGRSEIIICGLYWIRSVVEKLKVESFRISTAGLRFGLLYPPEEPESDMAPPKRRPFQKKDKPSMDSSAETDHAH